MAGACCSSNRQRLKESLEYWKSVWIDPWKDKPQDEDAAHRDISLDECISRLGFGKFQIKLLFVVSIIWVADAMEMMMIGFISPAVACEFNLTDASKAVLTTMVFVGMFFGAFAWGVFDDRFGRKKGYFASVLWTFCFGVACPFAPTYPVLCVLRMFVGFGVAGSHVAITIFSEFLPSNKRALFIVVVAMFWSVGTISEALLAWIVMPNVPESVTINGFEVTGFNWRVLVGLSSAPLALILLLWGQLPESPRFDLLHGNRESLQHTLRTIAKDNGRPMPKGKIVIIKHPEFSLLDQLKMLFVPAKMLRTTLLTWTIWFSSAFTIYGFVLINTELLLLEAEGEHCPEIYYHEPATITTLNTTWSNTTSSSTAGSDGCVRLEPKHYADAFSDSMAGFPGIIFTFFLLEFVGRKITMASEYFVVATMLAILCFCLQRFPQAAALFVGRGLMGGAWQAAFVFTSEAYPTAVRAIAMGSSSSMSRLGGMATPFVSQVLIHIKPRPFLAFSLYIISCIVSGVASMLLPMETKGRALRDVAAPDQDEGGNELDVLLQRENMG